MCNQTIYTAIPPMGSEDDLSEGTSLGDPLHKGTVHARFVSDLLPLPIVRDSGTACYARALSIVLASLKSLGVTTVRYFNVIDSNMDCLHVKVEDASGRLPWAAIIEHACLTSQKDGKALTNSYELKL